MKYFKLFESFINEAKDSVTFSIRDEKLDQLLHDFHERELDYVKVKGDEFYSLPKREFDRFIAAAGRKGFDEESWSYYEESANPIKEQINESGMGTLHLIADEAKDLNDFIKQVLKEFDFLKNDAGTRAFLEEVYDSVQANK